MKRLRTRVYKIYKRNKNDRRQNLFMQCLVMVWNALYENVVEIGLIEAFKRKFRDARTD